MQGNFETYNWLKNDTILMSFCVNTTYALKKYAGTRTQTYKHGVFA
jgi:hypothetical protein